MKNSSSIASQSSPSCRCKYDGTRTIGTVHGPPVALLRCSVSAVHVLLMASFLSSISSNVGETFWEFGIKLPSTSCLNPGCLVCP